MNIPVKSRDMIEEFIRSSDHYLVIDISKTGRERHSVYNALLKYVQRHSDLGISVKKIKGDIVLVKRCETLNG